MIFAGKEVDQIVGILPFAVGIRADMESWSAYVGMHDADEVMEAEGFPVICVAYKYRESSSPALFLEWLGQNRDMSLERVSRFW